MIKNDKTKLKNWLAGDVFALKINSNKYPDYNGILQTSQTKKY